MLHEICNISCYVYDVLRHRVNCATSFRTNIVGRAYQHLQYFPFGELFVSQRNTSFDSRYKFSAKELDNETNYTYFGARYYDSDLSNWLSVDPMACDYPSFSPYMYCAGNPLRFVDPDGEKIYIIDPATGEKHLYIPGQTILNSKEGSYVYKVAYTLDGISSSGRDKYQIVRTLANDQTSITINETEWNNPVGGVLNSSGGVIPWSPEGGTVISFLRRQIPAIVLLHELAHIFYDRYDPTGEIASQPSIYDVDYLEESIDYLKNESEKTGKFEGYDHVWILNNVEAPMKGARRRGHEFKGYYKAKDSFSLRGKKEKSSSTPSF
ncbi:MAG: RHS repeat-associated core domain-containing protein [Bacteroidales bacterium]|nr:RHS repeat-associated core domain-containing protein [Bacteroidales bacterium]